MFSHIVSTLTPKYGLEEAQEMAFWILEEVASMSRSEVLVCKFTKNFPNLQEKSEKISSILTKLLNNEPIQYIFGHTLWSGLDLLVSPATLIPRPETASLIPLLDTYLSQRLTNDLPTKVCKYNVGLPNTDRKLTEGLPNPCRVLDIGTGSGCIALAVKQSHPDWEVHAVDFSAAALDIARQNAERNHLEVNFHQLDILDSAKTLDFIGTFGPFDIVLSNPPYICDSERADMRSNVLDYEPATALFVPDSDPLLFYRTIASYPWGKTTCLNSESISENTDNHHFVLGYEINERFGDETVALLAEQGYHDILLNHDDFSKPRFVFSHS